MIGALRVKSGLYKWHTEVSSKLVNQLAIRILKPNANQGPDECSLSITKLGLSLVRHKFQQNLSKITSVLREKLHRTCPPKCKLGEVS